LIQVYTGNGKGKTTASLGLAFRASGHGFKVCMVQFMKSNIEYGETKAAAFIPGFRLIQVGRDEFVDLKTPEAIDKQLAQDGWLLAKEIISSKEYDIVILDEINVALTCGLLDVEEVTLFLSDLYENKTEIVLTGRYAPQPILELAHLVTEMQEIKHPFSQGIGARKGIDY